MKNLKIEFLEDHYYSPDGAKSVLAKAGEIVVVREKTALACICSGAARLCVPAYPPGFTTKESAIEEPSEFLTCEATQTNGKTCGRAMPCRYHHKD